MPALAALKQANFFLLGGGNRGSASIPFVCSGHLDLMSMQPVQDHVRAPLGWIGQEYSIRLLKQLVGVYSAFPRCEPAR